MALPSASSPSGMGRELRAIRHSVFQMEFELNQAKTDMDAAARQLSVSQAETDKHGPKRARVA